MTAPVLTAYAQPSDLQAYCDWREVGELISDSTEQLSPIDQLTHPNVIKALNRGAGELESAFLVSGRYTIAQLQALTGNSLELLIGANCDLALYWIYNRKPLLNQEKWKLYREVHDTLIKKLQDGTNVFNVQVNIDAGTPQAKGLSTVEYAQSGLTAWYPGMHYFPTPRQQFNNG